eukprot:2629444-Prymnesium_polylepis.1
MRACAATVYGRDTLHQLRKRPPSRVAGKRRAMHAQATRRRGARDMTWGVWLEGRALSRTFARSRGVQSRGGA